ncbi:MAG: hypothetical protein AB7F85_11055, partial [Hyphomonadaceae bacterium]
LQLFDVTHMFGMHLRPELVLLQKTMVQVEGVARGLDPKHDMWSASRPIVERWVQRELGPEAVTRRAIDEAALGFQALRRLPQTLLAVEAAARKTAIEAPRTERKWYEMPAVWIALLGGAILALALTANDRGELQPRQDAARMEREAVVNEALPATTEGANGAENPDAPAPETEKASTP